MPNYNNRAMYHMTAPRPYEHPNSIHNTVARMHQQINQQPKTVTISVEATTKPSVLPTQSGATDKITALDSKINGNTVPNSVWDVYDKSKEAALDYVADAKNQGNIQDHLVSSIAEEVVGGGIARFAPVRMVKLIGRLVSGYGIYSEAKSLAEIEQMKQQNEAFCKGLTDEQSQLHEVKSFCDPDHNYT